MAATYPPLTRAQQELVEAYRPFALSIAQRHRGRGVCLDDLNQEALVGLMLGAQRFDPAVGVTFATYAAWWVRASVWTALSRFGGPVRWGTTRTERRVYGLLTAAARKGQEDVDLEAIAAEVGTDLADAELIVARIRAGSGGDVSLNEDGPVPQLAAEVAPADEVAEDRERSRALAAAVARLPRLERQVLRARYLGPEQASQAAVGRQLGGVSRQRIQQIESQALERLRGRVGSLGLGADL